MPLEPLVLAIDDEPAILKLIKLELSANGFRVITAQSGDDGVRLEDEQRPDIVVLDLLMPDKDGLETMKEIRRRANVPIILLTGKDSDRDRVVGLEQGADDYLVKPFSPEELMARVRAVLRRGAGAAGMDQRVVLGNVTVDLGQGMIRRGDETVELTRREWMLLQQLAANPGRVMLNEELLTSIWGPEFRNDLQYLRVLVSRLRQKIEDDASEPRFLKTYPGIGYMLEVPGRGDRRKTTPPSVAAQT